MRKLNEKRNFKLMLFSFAIMAVVCLISFLTDPMAGAGVTSAFAIMIGGIQLTDEQEKEYHELIKNVTGEVQKKMNGYITETTMKESINAMLKEYSDNFTVTIDKVQGLNDALLAQAGLIKTLQEKPHEVEGNKSMREIIKGKFDTLKANIEKNQPIELKIPMSAINKVTPVIPSAITSNTAGMYLPRVGEIQLPKNVVVDIFQQFPMDANHNRTVYWTDWSTATRNAAARTVGNAAASSVAAWTVYSATLQSISDSIPVAKEMLTGGFGMMEMTLKNFITKNLMRKRDIDFISGDGNAPNIKGIYTYATAFDSAAYTGFKPVAANLYDLVVIMATEIMKATNYMVDFVILNPADTLKLKLAKDLDGQYLKPFILNGNQIDNIRIIESASQTINTLTIGDSQMATRYYGEQLTLDVGYDLTGDFSKRIVTILGNMEEMLLVRNCEADAFLKSTDINADVQNVTGSGN